MRQWNLRTVTADVTRIKCDVNNKHWTNLKKANPKKETESLSKAFSKSPKVNIFKISKRLKRHRERYGKRQSENSNLTEVEIQRGIFQGDLLSTLLSKYQLWH